MSRTFGASQNRFINKRNFQNQMIAFLGNKLDVGPALGEIFFVATSGGYWEDNLKYCGVDSDHIDTTVSAAEDKTTANSHDVVCVTPGAFVETASITWDKANTHLVGLGGKNIGGDYSEPNVVIYTVTTTIGTLLNVTGANCQFHNFVVENNYDAAGNLAAATINNYGTFWKNVAFHGNMQSTQNSTAACASLYIGASGMYPTLVDCIIGQDVWGTRAAANSGVLRFSETGGRPNGGRFFNCQFLSTGSTVTCAMVAIPAATSSGRGWLFDNCKFQHFNDAGASLNQAFYSVGSGVQKHSMILHKCSAYGIDEWQDANDDVVISTMGVATAGGGLHIEPTATVS